jgi:hypothetical protein
VEKDFYTVKEFAKAYGCSPDRVYEWLRAGKIEHRKRLTAHAVYRIPKNELARLKGKGEVTAKQSVVQYPVPNEFDPIIEKRRDEHFIKLGSIAESLLANNLYSVKRRWSRTESYIITNTTEADNHNQLTTEQLSAQLQMNVNSTIKKHGDWLFRTCFVPHLKSELPEELKTEPTELFFQVVEKHPYQIIKTLKLLAERKIFGGTCPVCEQW